jgi:hypothetical protein
MFQLRQDTCYPSRKSVALGMQRLVGQLPPRPMFQEIDCKLRSARGRRDKLVQQPRAVKKGRVPVQDGQVCHWLDHFGIFPNREVVGGVGEQQAGGCPNRDVPNNGVPNGVVEQFSTAAYGRGEVKKVGSY